VLLPLPKQGLHYPFRKHVVLTSPVYSPVCSKFDMTAQQENNIQGESTYGPIVPLPRPCYDTQPVSIFLLRGACYHFSEGGVS
jgi:hypothetical protein